MPPRVLTPVEENAARMAFEILQKKKLLKVNTGRGRKPGMAPVHAALAIRKGAFVKHGQARGLSADSQLCAAATAYSVPAKKIKEYLDLLVQCDAPESGARPLQTAAAARERLRGRAMRFELELADMSQDGNCFYHAIACILVDLGLRSSSYRHGNVRTDLADTLDKHQDDLLDSEDAEISLSKAALLATHDWRRPHGLADDAIWPPTEIHQAAFPLPPPPPHRCQVSRAHTCGDRKVRRFVRRCILDENGLKPLYYCVKHLLPWECSLQRRWVQKPRQC